jgi:hypothetical protein
VTRESLRFFSTCLKRRYATYGKLASLIPALNNILQGRCKSRKWKEFAFLARLQLHLQLGH